MLKTHERPAFCSSNERLCNRVRFFPLRSYRSALLLMSAMDALNMPVLDIYFKKVRNRREDRNAQVTRRSPEVECRAGRGRRAGRQLHVTTNVTIPIDNIALYGPTDKTLHQRRCTAASRDERGTLTLHDYGATAERSYLYIIQRQLLQATNCYVLCALYLCPPGQCSIYECTMNICFPL